MFKKLTTLLIACSFFMTSSYASSDKGLKAAFDELQYALTVEWDQEDKGFYESSMAKFRKKVSELRKEGLTNAQMMELVKTESKGTQMAKNIETALTMIEINKMDLEEATQYMIETLEKSQDRGASWVGGVSVAVGSLAFFALIFYLLKDVPAAGGNNHPDDNVCSNPVTVCGQSCDYDVYWGESCYEHCWQSCNDTTF